MPASRVVPVPDPLYGGSSPRAGDHGLIAVDPGHAPRQAARAYDALIAATALANGLPVYTCNAADFDGIDGLQVMPVTLTRRS